MCESAVSVHLDVLAGWGQEQGQVARKWGQVEAELGCRWWEVSGGGSVYQGLSRVPLSHTFTSCHKGQSADRRNMVLGIV